MIRSELNELLASHFKQLTVVNIKAATDAIIDALVSTLAKGERIEIRGFGSFKLNHRPPRIGRNPRTGVVVSVPAKAAPHFKMGKELQARVDKTQS